MLGDVTIQSSPSAARAAPDGSLVEAAPSSAGGYDLTVVVPTYKEAANVAAVLQRLKAALSGRRWHVVFVDDDSPDGTAEAIKALARTDPRVSCLRRIGRRGLAGAVMEGALASAAPWIVVMDADGQHDEGLILPMLERAQLGDVDVVVASRYVDVGSAEGGLSRTRRRGSRLATRLAQLATRLTLTDPMSGFFLVRRSALNAVAPRVSPHGFKVLFDILACANPPMRAAELPLVFRPRLQGESKLDRRVVLEYLALLGSKVSGDLISPRALVYAVVGATGLAVHLIVLRGLMSVGLGFGEANLFAAAAAMTSNYLLNNEITYRDRRRQGLGLFWGYLKFAALCALGLAINIAVADFAQERLHIWWVSGVLGAVAAAAWNYGSTAVALW
jgi:dolichol-phosphate mannosyltransferase